MEGVVTCDVCRSGIDYPIYFQLNPCFHRACVKCFHELVPARVFNRCPCSDCHEWISSSTLLEISSSGCQTKNPAPTTDNATRDPNDDSTRGKTDSDATTEKPPKNTSIFVGKVQEILHFQPDEQMDPFRHWSIKKPDLYTGLIYVAYRSSENEATFYKSNFKAFDTSVFMDDNSTDEMVKIFARVLHPLLFQQRRDNGAGSPRPTTGGAEPQTPPPCLATPDKNIHHHHPSTQDSCPSEHYHRQDRQHLAMRCLYALSSGRILTRSEQEEKLFGAGTTKNLKRRDHQTQTAPFLATQRLARELQKAYQASCMARKKVTFEEPSPLISPLQPIVHDLRRPRREKGSERKLQTPQKAPMEFCEVPHLIGSPDESEGSPDKAENFESEYERESDDQTWANELGLMNEAWGSEINKNDGEFENASSPIVPAILWMLSAVFILSK